MRIFYHQIQLHFYRLVQDIVLNSNRKYKRVIFRRVIHCWKKVGRDWYSWTSAFVNHWIEGCFWYEHFSCITVGKSYQILTLSSGSMDFPMDFFLRQTQSWRELGSGRWSEATKMIRCPRKELFDRVRRNNWAERCSWRHTLLRCSRNL